MNRFEWSSPATASEAAAAATAVVADAMRLAPEDAAAADFSVVKAGGLDLLDLMKENLLAPRRIVNLRAVPGLDAIVEGGAGTVRVGSMVTLTRLAGHPLVRDRYPALSDAARSAASPQIRNVATVGGNLLQRPRCWYFRAAEYRCLRKGGSHCFAFAGENQYHAIFDHQHCAIVHPSTVATPLVALDATVEVADARGQARRISLEDFLVLPERDFHRENVLKPHEILTAVELPAMPATTRMAHLKQGEKDSFDWPLADVAAVLTLSADGRCSRAGLVLGAAAPVPHRARRAETTLIGQRIDEAAARRAARAALEGAQPLTGNAYKLPLFETLVRRAILQAAASF